MQSRYQLSFTVRISTIVERSLESSLMWCVSVPTGIVYTVDTAPAAEISVQFDSITFDYSDLSAIVRSG